MIVMATFSFPNKDGSESVILHALLSSAKILSSRGAWCETVLGDAFLTNDNRQGLSHLPQQGGLDHDEFSASARNHGISSQRWMTCVRNHAKAIVACDFCTAVMATFRLLYVFVRMEHATGATASIRVSHCVVCGTAISRFTPN
jgi:hypothetical protein